MEQRGILQSWNDDKGFGFIQPEGGGDRLFVHISAMRGNARPNQGETVLFVIGTDEKGRLRATHMRGEALSIDRPSIRRKPGTASRPLKQPIRAVQRKNRPGSAARSGRIQQLPLKILVGLALCLLPLTGSLVMYSRSGWIAPLMMYVGVSLVCFVLYRADKRSAQESRQRTPENILHLSELLGGWPGALIAQQLLRHKTRKISYQAVFWCVVSAHQLFWADWLILDGRYLRPWLANWF